MLRRLAIPVLLFVAAASTWAADSPKPLPRQQSSAKQASATAKKPLRKGKKKPTAQKTPDPVPETILAAPPAPPTLEQQPAIAPEVSYRGGQLTINARNATMNDVLTAVRRVTGASIDRPPSSGSERVVGIYGPGQPKDVLTDLLNGSRYDYIILGSTTRPGGIDRIMLTPRNNQPTAVANNTPQPNSQPGTNQQNANQDQDSEPDTDAEDETAPERDEQPEAQPDQQAPPENQPPQQAQPEQQNQQQQPGQPNQQQNQQNQVKSPEELLRELQQMQQQQQQQQQQQNPPQ